MKKEGNHAEEAYKTLKTRHLKQESRRSGAQAMGKSIREMFMKPWTQTFSTD
jgi:hypothetical protein